MVASPFTELSRCLFVTFAHLHACGVSRLVMRIYYDVTHDPPIHLFRSLD